MATVGHVDRAWGCSFIWKRAYQLDVFEAMLREILDGYPVGAAMEHFSDRHAQLAALLGGVWERREASRRSTLGGSSTCGRRPATRGRTSSWATRRCD